MKRKLLSVALLALLSVGLVAACDNEDEDGGNVEYSIAITNKAELQEAWYIGDSTRSISVELSPEGNPTQEVTTGALTVVSSDPSVIAATGLNLSAQSLGEATITVSWHGASDSVNLTVSETVYDSIATINAGIKEGTIKDGDTVHFYGKVIASMEQSSSQIGNGVYLGDGDNTLMLYGGQLSSVWFSEELSLGDDIAVAATVSAYNGFYEYNPTLITSLSSDYTVSTTSLWTPTETEWLATDYTQVGRPVTLTLNYKSGTISDSSSHGSVYFTFPESETEVLVYCNYHNGTTEQSALMSMVKALDVGDEVTITGVVGWYNKAPQLCPQFMLIDGEEVTPSECFVPNPKPGTENLTITWDGKADDETKALSLEKYFSEQLSVEVDEGADKNVTWSVALPDSGTTETKYLDTDELTADEILSISSTGKIHGLAEGSVVVTATAVKAGETSGQQATDSITVTVTELTHTTPFCTCENSNEYYLGMASDDDWKYYLITGATVEGYAYEGVVTTELASATKVKVSSYEGSDRAFTLSFTLSEKTYYIAIVTSGTHVNVNYVKTETPIYWSYELGCWTDEDESHFLCYNSTYGCLYCSAVASYYGSSPLALLTTEEEISDFLAPIDVELATSITSEGTYYLGYESSDNVKSMFNGTAYSSYELILSTEDHANKWVEITVTANSNATPTSGDGGDTSETTYTLSFTDSNGETHIIYGYESGDYGDLYFGSEDDISQKSGVSAFTYSETDQTLCCTIGENSYFIGVDATHSNEITICSSGATNTPCHLYSLKEASPE